MRIYVTGLTLVVFSAVGLCAPAWGQVTRDTSSQGLFGTRSVGGGATQSTRTFGGAGGSMASQTQANVGQVDSSDRFVRGSRQAGAFVGVDSSDAQNFLGAVQAGAGNRATGQTLSGLSTRGGAGANQRGNAGRARQSRTDIRTSLRVAFDYPTAPPTAVGTTLARRLTGSQRFQSLSALEVLVKDGTATLRGAVANANDRGLAERLVLLEPGIWHVKNELLIAEVPAEPEPATPAVPEPAAVERPAGPDILGDSPAEPPAPPAPNP
ncbi:MAG: BON domain-containing protein [Pirellulales bacterium]|nr:BON domain-containing protein [Pirellulales bacterium]